MINRKKRVFAYYHPILFSLYPVTALLVHNIDQLRPIVGLRVVLFSLVLGSAVYAWSRLVFKRIEKAAIAASLIMIFFLSYGQVYELLEGRTLLSLIIGRHRYLAVIWLLALGALLWLLYKNKGQLAMPNRLLNWISLSLVVILVAQFAWFQVNVRGTAKSNGISSVSAATVQSKAGVVSPLPDVYYIILDAYTRDDTLQRVHHYDNSAFIKKLEDLGFYVAPCSQSNYGFTVLSIASSLNFDYLQNIASDIIARKGRLTSFTDMTVNNPVRQTLESLGYRTVGFETGYPNDELTNAAYYITRSDNPVTGTSKITSLNPFEMLFLRTTFLRVGLEAQSAFFGKLSRTITTPEQNHYDQIMFVLGQLDNMPAVPGPKFVYAHIIAPHEPFVLAPDGHYLLTSDPSGYTNGVTYLDQRISGLVANLIEQSKVPPIIILQGDHGWGDVEHMTILNAYYLPGKGKATLYAKISPVNSFRIVLNEYFGGKYPLLEDKSYLSQFNTPYDFSTVPNSCERAGQP
jgi:hypothetical protein